MNDWKLCYAEDNRLWFAPADAVRVKGDGWHKLAFEHNASTPYYWDDEAGNEHTDFKHLMYAGDVYVRANAGHLNSPWSVNDLNKGNAAWLRADRWGANPDAAPIQAGVGMFECIKIMRRYGEQVFVPTDWLLPEMMAIPMAVLI